MGIGGRRIGVWKSRVEEFVLGQVRRGGSF